MSDIINILPDSVANQIAAGEVVDRPASAVKELLENAIDAGATCIQLIIKDAGRTLIQVVDNGCGMSESDARLCFERHATSKIHKADDLFAIQTMGFRGEALASIAAIAQVELRTRTKDSELGTQVVIEGSRIVSQMPCTCPVGTSIAVKNLFYNIPARRNFLKRDSIEISHIEEIFRRITLVNHDIAFSFHSNGRLLYDLHAGDVASGVSPFAERISQLFGNNMPEKLFPVNEHTDIVNVNGYVAKPEYARKSRGEQYLFVNHRFIKHLALSAAVEKAYTDLIPQHYYPSYFLHIDIDPSRIDINIHPTKTEVKFIDEQHLFSILRAATKKALGQFSLATEFEFNPSTELDFTPAPKDYIPVQPTVHYNPDYNPFSSVASGKSSGGVRTGASAFPGSHTEGSRPVDRDKWENFFKTENADEKAGSPSNSFSIPLNDNAQPVSNSPTCLQVHGRYIVGSLPSGLLVVDQQAAHERILYERLMQQGQAPQTSQQLLFPANCSFSPADADIFNEMLPDLRNRGFEIAPLKGANQTFVVTATPPDVRDSELQNLFDQLIIEYKSSMLQKFNDRTQCLCRSLAHQLAIKPDTPLQQDEMQQIVADLFCCKMPHTSPFGKKTFTVVSPEKLMTL